MGQYTASKGGIIRMSETLAIEWAPFGIMAGRAEIKSVKGIA